MVGFVRTVLLSLVALIPTVLLAKPVYTGIKIDVAKLAPLLKREALLFNPKITSISFAEVLPAEEIGADGNPQCYMKDDKVLVPHFIGADPKHLLTWIADAEDFANVEKTVNASNTGDKQNDYARGCIKKLQERCLTLLKKKRPISTVSLGWQSMFTISEAIRKQLGMDETESDNLFEHVVSNFQDILVVFVPNGKDIYEVKDHLEKRKSYYMGSDVDGIKKRLLSEFSSRPLADGNFISFKDVWGLLENLQVGKDNFDFSLPTGPGLLSISDFRENVFFKVEFFPHITASFESSLLEFLQILSNSGKLKLSGTNLYDNAIDFVGALSKESEMVGLVSYIEDGFKQTPIPSYLYKFVALDKDTFNGKLFICHCPKFPISLPQIDDVVVHMALKDHIDSNKKVVFPFFKPSGDEANDATQIEKYLNAHPASYSLKREMNEAPTILRFVEIYLEFFFEPKTIKKYLGLPSDFSTGGQPGSGMSPQQEVAIQTQINQHMEVRKGENGKLWVSFSITCFSLVTGSTTVLYYFLVFKKRALKSHDAEAVGDLSGSAAETASGDE